jgi:hypothetical protein
MNEISPKVSPRRRKKAGGSDAQLQSAEETFGAAQGTSEPL